MMTYDELTDAAAEEMSKQQGYRHCVRVCTAAGCLSQHNDMIKTALTEAVKAQGSEDAIQVKGVGCMGLCAAGPLVMVEPDGVLYERVAPEDAPAIIQSLGQKPVKKLVCATNTPFFERQVKIVLENSGVIDPESLDEYIAAGGYEGLNRALTELSPGEVIAELVKSGLRGRGGAGYPTGLKWSTVAKAISDTKFVICNGDEGDPGAFMDRSILESDPHRIIEGMVIAGYAVGANRGFIYVRAEYPLAIERLKLALRHAKRSALLGDNILGTGFAFNLEIRLGAGAYVCGEETALMGSIEGKRGMPRPRPPYPADHGLWGEPTLVNNVETFANVAPILRRGGAWYASIGSDTSKGTKVFALAGQIRNTGLIEVPMGITLNEIVHEIGGGTSNGHQVKAVQTGGPTGGCIPQAYFETPVDYESLTKLGSIMGSGGMIVMDETSSMVDIAKYFMEFCMTESCGKCIPCRVGTAQMYHLLDKFSKGCATAFDLDLLEQLCDLARSASLCGLGQSAPNPVLSTLQYFRDEYISRIIPAEPALAPALDDQAS